MNCKRLFGLVGLTISVGCGGAQAAAPDFIQFNVKKVKTINYVYKAEPPQDDIPHTLATYKGEGGGYQIEEHIVDDNGLVFIQISRGGKVVLKKELPRWKGLCEDSFSIVDPKNNKDSQLKPIARDINKDGYPDLIIFKNDNLNHSPDDITIYKLSDAPPKLIFSKTLQSPAFTDLDKNGIYDIVIDDQTFQYWRDSAYAQNPQVAVVLEPANGDFKPSRRLTFEKAPTQAEITKTEAALEKEIDQYKKHCKPGTRAITPTVWAEFVKLIYSNNAATAKSIMDNLYPGSTKLVVAIYNPEADLKDAKVETKEQFWNDIVTQAKKSPYIQALAPKF